MQESLIWIIQNSPANGEEICSLLLGDRGCGEFQRSPWKVPLPPRRHPAPAHPHLDATPTAHYKRDNEVSLEIFCVLSNRCLSGIEILYLPLQNFAPPIARLSLIILNPWCNDNMPSLSIRYWRLVIMKACVSGLQLHPSGTSHRASSGTHHWSSSGVHLRELLVSSGTLDRASPRCSEQQEREEGAQDAAPHWPTLRPRLCGRIQCSVWRPTLLY